MKHINVLNQYFHEPFWTEISNPQLDHSIQAQLDRPQMELASEAVKWQDDHKAGHGKRIFCTFTLW